MHTFQGSRRRAASTRIACIRGETVRIFAISTHPVASFAAHGAITCPTNAGLEEGGLSLANCNIYTPDRHLNLKEKRKTSTCWTSKQEHFNDTTLVTAASVSRCVRVQLEPYPRFIAPRSFPGQSGEPPLSYERAKCTPSTPSIIAQVKD